MEARANASSKGVINPYCIHCMGQYFAGNPWLFINLCKTQKAQDDKGERKPKSQIQYSCERVA
eukprot:3187611-Prorocentrum_lima.AAC.1